MTAIERLREKIARRLIWWAKCIDPGNKWLGNANQGWSIDLEWMQPLPDGRQQKRARDVDSDNK